MTDPAPDPYAQIRAMPFPALLGLVAGMPMAQADATLWYRLRHDVEAFAVVCFPERCNAAFNELHRDLFARQKPGWKHRSAPVLEAVAAPRGAAKSTIATYVDLAHDVVYGLERFIGVISTSFDLSESLVNDLYELFSQPDNAPEFHRLYGPFRVVGGKTAFTVWSPSGSDKHGTRIKAYSMLGQCRGHKHAGTRFTKWVLDDAESSESAHNADQNDKHDKFVEADVVKAGINAVHVRMLGTVLTTDAVLARKLDPTRSPMWSGSVYRAIQEWPAEKEGKWQEVRRIWTDLALGDAEARRAAALAYYLEHRAELDAGSRVLWPSVGDGLFGLMLEFWQNPAAFYAERQNEPGRGEATTFDVAGFRWVEFDGFRLVLGDAPSVLLSTCRIRGWWDPIPYRAKGTGKDAAGYAVVAQDHRGAQYVLFADVERGNPQRQWSRLWELMRRFPDAEWGYENNTGAAEDSDEFRRQLQGVKNELGKARIQGHQTRGAEKKTRIADLQPKAANGFLRFVRGAVSDAVIGQFRGFPTGHDDGPDAIERACWLLAQGPATLRHTQTLERR